MTLGILDLFHSKRHQVCRPDSLQKGCVQAQRICRELLCACTAQRSLLLPCCIDQHLRMWVIHAMVSSKCEAQELHGTSTVASSYHQACEQ